MYVSLFKPSNGATYLFIDVNDMKNGLNTTMLNETMTDDERQEFNDICSYDDAYIEKVGRIEGHHFIVKVWD